jgi:hypothetical protein
VEKTGTPCGTSFLLNFEGMVAFSGAGAGVSADESAGLFFGLATVSLPEVGGPWAQIKDATERRASRRRALISTPYHH